MGLLLPLGSLDSEVSSGSMKDMTLQGDLSTGAGNIFSSDDELKLGDDIPKFSRTSEGIWVVMFACSSSFS